MTKRRFIGLLLIIPALLLVWILYHKQSQTSLWQPLKTGPVVSAIYGLGTVTSDRIYHLKVPVPTHVKKLYVREGDEVHKGQPLALLNGLPIFYAGFDGTITSLPLNENENVVPNTEVLTLMDLRNCYVLVALEQESAVKIRKGLKVKLTFSGLSHQPFKGTVISIYPKDQESYIKIAVNKLPPSILPQMSSDVAIILEEKSNAILIPINAIQNAHVTIKRQGKMLNIPIQLGTTTEEYAEVISKNLLDHDLIMVKA